MQFTAPPFLTPAPFVQPPFIPPTVPPLPRMIRTPGALPYTSATQMNPRISDAFPAARIPDPRTMLAYQSSPFSFVSTGIPANADHQKYLAAVAARVVSSQQTAEPQK